MYRSAVGLGVGGLVVGLGVGLGVVGLGVGRGVVGAAVVGRWVGFFVGETVGLGVEKHSPRTLQELSSMTDASSPVEKQEQHSTH